MSKEILWIATSLDDLREFPSEVKQYVGHQLHSLQEGLIPTDTKPMKTIGSGVYEIRAKDKDGIYRVIYVTKIADSIGVLHCFQKKDEKTPNKEIKLAKARLKDLMREKEKVK